MQPDVAFGAFDRNAAVAGINIHAAIHGLYVNRAVAGVDLHMAAQTVEFPLIRLPVSICRSAFLGMRTSMRGRAVHCPGKAPVTVTRA